MSVDSKGTPVIPFVRPDMHQGWGYRRLSQCWGAQWTGDRPSIQLTEQSTCKKEIGILYNILLVSTQPINIFSPLPTLLPLAYADCCGGRCMCGLRLHREQIRASKNLKICEEREWVLTRLNMHPVIQFFVYASIHPQWYASSLNWRIKHISLFQNLPQPHSSLLAVLILLTLD